jgi:trafficking protein particle complex subunit 10
MEALQARLYLSRFIHIDKRRSIEVEISSGWNDVDRAEVRLKSGSAGLRLRTGDATAASGNATIASTPGPGTLGIGSMGPDSVATFQVPYELETVLPELAIKLEMDYFTEKGEFHYHSVFTVPIELPLDVNVHDHFKNESLYSKFNIKTSSNVPLNISGVDLEGSDEYEVQGQGRPPTSTVVFPRQPLSMTYKITKRAADVMKKRQSRAPAAGSLALSVEYRCLDEDVLDRIRGMFAAAVENSPVHRLARLLIAIFADRLEHRVLPQQFEKIALLDKVDLGPFENMGWGECIDGLPHIVRDDTRAWLHKWHEVRFRHAREEA